MKVSHFLNSWKKRVPFMFITIQTKQRKKIHINKNCGLRYLRFSCYLQYKRWEGLEWRYYSGGLYLHR